MSARRGCSRARRDAPYERGYAVTLEVPIFDSGSARVKKSEAIYAQAVDRFTQAAIEARSQIRLAYAGYRAAFELAMQQRDEVLPLRKAVVQENLLRYNASQISIFELLSECTRTGRRHRWLHSTRARFLDRQIATRRGIARQMPRT